MTDGKIQGSGGVPEKLAGVEEAARRERGLPPVDKWNPPFSGELDMRIAADGTWYYQGGPITRRRMVRLFSTVLRHDADGRFYLVTPVEKFAITVEDAPFLAVRMAVTGAGREQTVRFETNVDDEVAVDGDHPLRFEREEAGDGLKPYVLVRGRLEALVTRALAYDLADLGCDEVTGDGSWFGVWSGGVFHRMVPSEELAV